mgnify:CR=1 FL=1
MEFEYTAQQKALQKEHHQKERPHQKALQKQEALDQRAVKMSYWQPHQKQAHHQPKETQNGIM